MMFLIRCPNCHNRMKYQTNTRILTGKRKRCMYCGKSFGIIKNLVKEEK